MKDPKSDVTVLLVTFFLTVIFDLTIAIEIGLVIACVLFIKRVMETTEISVIENEIHPNEETEECLSIPEGCAVYEINGPYFFGIANKFEELESVLKAGSRPKVQIIRMRRVPFIDSTGIHNLTTLVETNNEKGTEVILSGVTPKVQKQLLKAKFHKVLGSKNFCNNIDEALQRAKELLDK
jgi:SulP family sulfate permease